MKAGSGKLSDISATSWVNIATTGIATYLSGRATVKSIPRHTPAKLKTKATGKGKTGTTAVKEVSGEMPAVSGKVSGGSGSKGGNSTKKYYQVTSKENAQALINSDKPALKGTEFKEVYVWTEQPTMKQAQNSGARYLDTVIEFETNASFSRDSSIVDSSLWNIARVSDRPGPISISNVVEVGFKKSKGWWQFWKK